MKRATNLIVYGTLKRVSITFPTENKEPSAKPVGTLYRLLQFKPFPWMMKGIAVSPINIQDQILAIPINDQSLTVDISELYCCLRIRMALHLCDFKTLDIKPFKDSCSWPG